MELFIQKYSYYLKNPHNVLASFLDVFNYPQTDHFPNNNFPTEDHHQSNHSLSQSMILLILFVDE